METGSELGARRPPKVYEIRHDWSSDLQIVRSKAAPRHGGSLPKWPTRRLVSPVKVAVARASTDGSFSLSDTLVDCRTVPSLLLLSISLGSYIVAALDNCWMNPQLGEDVDAVLSCSSSSLILSISSKRVLSTS